MEKNNIHFECDIMTDEDLTYIYNHITLFDEFWSSSTLEDDYKSPLSTYFIVRDKDHGNVIIGFAGIKTITNFAEVMNIVVKKDKRNIGVGSVLLEYVIDYCKKQGLNNLNLEVNRDNKPAVTIYKRHQFETVGLRKKYYNNKSDALLMTLYFKR